MKPTILACFSCGKGLDVSALEPSCCKFCGSGRWRTVQKLTWRIRLGLWWQKGVVLLSEKSLLHKWLVR